jgi:DNA-binding transcriptional regulator YhcF (GntR family)
MGNKMFKSTDGMFIPRRMHRTPVFRKLTTIAILVLLEFLSRRQVVKIGRRDRLIIKNNGEIVLTYAEITKKFGIARSTYRNALDQLVDLGFIDIAHHGGGMMKDSSKYGISDRWREYGKEEFIKKSRKKDNRKLGYTKDNWEDRTGRKRKRKSKIGINNDTNSSITKDTREHKTPVTPSINHATHQIDPNYYIQKGLEVLEARHPPQYH